MAKILNADINTNLGGENASDYAVPSQKAVKTYVDAKVASLDVTSDTDGNVVLDITIS